MAEKPRKFSLDAENQDFYRSEGNYIHLRQTTLNQRYWQSSQQIADNVDKCLPTNAGP